jgi:hypothetical protein
MRVLPRKRGCFDKPGATVVKVRAVEMRADSAKGLAFWFLKEDWCREETLLPLLPRPLAARNDLFDESVSRCTAAPGIVMREESVVLVLGDWFPVNEMTAVVRTTLQRYFLHKNVNSPTLERDK